MLPDLVERRKTDRLFLEQLLDTSKLENYSVPVVIKADLRKYQQVSVRHNNVALSCLACMVAKSQKIVAIMT